MRWGAVAVSTVLVAACEAPPAGVVTMPPVNAPTPAPTRPLGVAVAVGSPTPTAEVVGDYATLMRPRLQTLHDDFGHLQSQLAEAEKTPMRMAEDDWRNQTQGVLEDMLTSSADIRATSMRATTQSPLRSEVLKLADDVDFVANEFRMALDYDPDATHFMRAGRAEKTTSAELDSILREMH